MQFVGYQKKHAVRKERNDEEETWQLSRFYPMIEVYIRFLSRFRLY